MVVELGGCRSYRNVRVAVFPAFVFRASGGYSPNVTRHYELNDTMSQSWQHVDDIRPIAQWLLAAFSVIRH